MARNRSSTEVILAVLALLVAVVALLFGDNLLGRGEPQPASGPGAASAPAGGAAPETAPSEPRAPAAARASDPIPAGRPAREVLDRIPDEEWCYAGVAALLRRVLQSTTRAELEQAADVDDPRAQLLVGRAHLDGLFGFPKDLPTAFSFIKRAASQGNPSAVNALGAFYEAGWGVEADPYAAVRLYRRSSEAGCAQGTYNLGRASTVGWGGVREDRQEALRLFRIAAAEGLELARDAVERYSDNPE